MQLSMFSSEEPHARITASATLPEPGLRGKDWMEAVLALPSHSQELPSDTLQSGLFGRMSRMSYRIGIPTAFCTDLGEGGYHLAWRVLDQRHIGQSDQPRPRLFVVGNRTDWRRSAAVLLEPEGFGGNSEARSQAAPVLTARGGMAFDDRTPCILDQHGPRIATPMEWERAMGFPDNFTRVPYRGKVDTDCPDGPRFKAMGNSMSVDVMEWLGERIDLVESLSPATTE